jgi:uncharacterized membrane protein
MNQATDHDGQFGSWVAAAALGAIAMYMLDPERGAARRAQSGRMLRQLGRQGGDVPDQVTEGIGSRVGEASAASEAAPLIHDGVSHIADAANEGEDLRHNQAQPAAPATWGGGKRSAVIAGGGALGLAGLLLARPSLRLTLGLAGLTLVARGAANRPLRSVLGSRGHAVEVEKTIRIDAPPEQVFDQFANYDNFPRFMSNVVEVRDLGEGRAQWVVRSPAGTESTWNAVLTDTSRPRRLAWHSEPDADVDHAGSIVFEPFRGGTRVSVHLSYRPPAGKRDHALASLLGSAPNRQMDDDLARMKTLIERSATAHHGGVAGAAAGSKFLH